MEGRPVCPNANNSGARKTEQQKKNSQPGLMDPLQQQQQHHIIPQMDSDAIADPASSNFNHVEMSAPSVHYDNPNVTVPNFLGADGAQIYPVANPQHDENNSLWNDQIAAGTEYDELAHDIEQHDHEQWRHLPGYDAYLSQPGDTTGMEVNEDSEFQSTSSHALTGQTVSTYSNVRTTSTNPLPNIDEDKEQSAPIEEFACHQPVPDCVPSDDRKTQRGTKEHICATCHRSYTDTAKLCVKKSHLKDKNQIACKPCYDQFGRLDKKNKSKPIGQCQEKFPSSCVKITTQNINVIKNTKGIYDCCIWTFFMEKGYISSAMQQNMAMLRSIRDRLSAIKIRNCLSIEKTWKNRIPIFLKKFVSKPAAQQGTRLDENNSPANVDGTAEDGEEGEQQQMAMMQVASEMHKATKNLLQPPEAATLFTIRNMLSIIKIENCVYFEKTWKNRIHEFLDKFASKPVALLLDARLNELVRQYDPKELAQIWKIYCIHIVEFDRQVRVTSHLSRQGHKLKEQFDWASLLAANSSSCSALMDSSPEESIKAQIAKSFRDDKYGWGCLWTIKALRWQRLEPLLRVLEEMYADSVGGEGMFMKLLNVEGTNAQFCRLFNIMKLSCLELNGIQVVAEENDGNNGKNFYWLNETKYFIYAKMLIIKQSTNIDTMMLFKYLHTKPVLPPEFQESFGGTEFTGPFNFKTIQFFPLASLDCNVAASCYNDETVIAFMTQPGKMLSIDLVSIVDPDGQPYKKVDEKGNLRLYVDKFSEMYTNAFLNAKEAVSYLAFIETDNLDQSELLEVFVTRVNKKTGERLESFPYKIVEDLEEQVQPSRHQLQHQQAESSGIYFYDERKFRYSVAKFPNDTIPGQRRLLCLHRFTPRPGEKKSSTKAWLEMNSAKACSSSSIQQYDDDVASIEMEEDKEEDKRTKKKMKRTHGDRET